MKRLFVLAAVALSFVLTLPASAQYWGTPGSAGIIDEASTSLYEFNNATLQFKSGQTGTIVARYPVGGNSVLDPGWNYLVFTSTGPGVSVRLLSVLSCSGSQEQIASWGPSTGTSINCQNIDVSSTYWDNPAIRTTSR